MDTAQTPAPTKSVKKSVNGTRPFAKGYDPRRGTGKPGRSGRKPIAFVAECERITDTLILPKLEQYVSSHSPDDEGYRWAATKLLEYAKGKPAAVQVTVNQTNNYLLETPAKTPTPEEWRARFAGRN